MALLLAFTWGCTNGTEGPGPNAPPRATSKLDRADVERDIELLLTQTTPEPLRVQQDTNLRVSIKNDAQDTTFPLVVPGDGSDAGWREPHAFFTVEVPDGSGGWTSARRLEAGRCGNYASDWAEDILWLAPGEEFLLRWFPFDWQWDIGEAGRLRITAHYSYGQHAALLGDALPRALQRMPPFELASVPLEVSVVR